MPTMAKASISTKLQQLRERWGTDGKRLSQEDAAAKIGVSRRSWISWERGDRKPPPAIVLLIDLLLEK